MDVRARASFLAHDGPEAAPAFCRDVLGFEVRGDVGRGRMRRLTVGPGGQAVTSVVPRPAGAAAGFPLATPDLDPVLERPQAHAEVIQGPIEQPYGVREGAFRAPAGDMIWVQELHGDAGDDVLFEAVENGRTRHHEQGHFGRPARR